MREIKFRAYDKENEIMFYEFEQNDVFIAKMQDKEDWKHLVLMQYTGLKDKNGVEIYEGDILIDDNYPEEGIGYAVVEFDKNGFSANPWFGVEEFSKEAEYYEVIGNIFENKDLYAKL